MYSIYRWFELRLAENWSVSLVIGSLWKYVQTSWVRCLAVWWSSHFLKIAFWTAPYNLTKELMSGGGGGGEDNEDVIHAWLKSWLKIESQVGSLWPEFIPHTHKFTGISLDSWTKLTNFSPKHTLQDSSWVFDSSKH